VEPEREKDVQPPVQRVNSTVIAAAVLGLLIIGIVAAILIGNRSGDDDRLTDSGAATASRQDPEQRCSGSQTYDRIKRELFDRAADLRGSDKATFQKVGSYSALRMEAPVVRDENEKVGSVSCTATAYLDLPPGLAVVGGRRSLNGELGYTVQPAADGTGDVITLTSADSIVTPLATLARVGGAQGSALDGAEDTVTPAPDAPDAPGDPLAPAPPHSPPVAPAPPAAPAAPAASASSSPSFNCRNARTRGEIAVCESAGLAALDRTMSSQYSAAVADASPQQRATLARTRDSFLRYRDDCPSDSCIAQTYRGRMREIRDIMRGNWTPER
jgi:uncharacterized protein YecT (DUF1311 family)